jgi:hypothetical protein
VVSASTDAFLNLIFAMNAWMNAAIILSQFSGQWLLLAFMKDGYK